ncbi:hypothetical protein [Leucothrix mucor]|uniref:hypothetical protein n=1 Tax=Leucothrix mucor TaxID=45248 RepID=UPI0003B57335|nr:hypothetical protein [Leucothrix mucor]
MLVWLAGFVLGVLSIAEYWDYDFKAPDIDKMLATQVSTQQIKTEIDTALRDEQFDEARSLLTTAQQFNHPLDYPAYQQYLIQHDTTTSRLVRQVSGFADGFISGKGQEASGVAGALVADFTVVGDVRDLNEQYGRYQQGLPINQLVTSLAGVGVGLTAATIGSAGFAAPVKAGASTLKLATKMNRLTRGFRDELTHIAGRVFNWDAFFTQVKGASLSSIPRIAKQMYNPQAANRLSAIAGQANDIRKSTSVADSVNLLKYVDNTQDLSRLHRVTQRYGVQTTGIFRLLGKGAVRGVKMLRLTIELILSALVSLFCALMFVASIGGKRKAN